MKFSYYHRKMKREKIPLKLIHSNEIFCKKFKYGRCNKRKT